MPTPSKLSPTEQKFFAEIHEHCYPDPAPGVTMPVDTHEMRVVRSLARKGFVTLTQKKVPLESVSLCFTSEGVAAYMQYIRSTGRTPYSELKPAA